MRFSRMITVVGAHAEGELNEVITGGVIDVPGKTMFEKMRWLEANGDDLRKFLLFEPRGLGHPLIQFNVLANAFDELGGRTAYRGDREVS